MAEFFHAAVQYPRPGWGEVNPLPFEDRSNAYTCGTSLFLGIN